jgi:hypothetical protein
MWGANLCVRQRERSGLCCHNIVCFTHDKIAMLAAPSFVFQGHFSFLIILTIFASKDDGLCYHHVVLGLAVGAGTHLS